MFDILFYVFENCRQADVSHDPERVARKLSAAGFDDMEISAALTWLPTARQESPFRAVSNNQLVGGSAVGKRLPYAPRWLATVQAGYRLGDWDVSAEVQAIDDQFSDFANTQEPVQNGNGQIGRIAGHAVWNLTCNWTPEHTPWSAFVTVKNASELDGLPADYLGRKKKRV